MEQLNSHAYPAIYFKKVESSSKPERLDELDFPSLVDYDFKLGDNFSEIIYEEQVSGMTLLLQIFEPSDFITFYSLCTG